MNCQKCKTEIEERDLRRESLSGTAEAHLETCVSCRVFGQERLALSRLVGELEKLPAPDDFDFRMRARMAAEIGARAPRPGWFNFSPAALSWPLAGCLALLISASLYLQQRQSNTSATLTERTISSSFTPKIEEAKPSIERAKVTKPQPSFGAPTVRTSLPQRRRVAPERVGAKRSVEIAKVQESIEESNFAGVTGAPVRFASTGATGGKSDMIPVQLTAPERPLKVLLHDMSGNERTISVDSVTFGSRDVTGRSATFKNASISSNQGVW